MNVSIAAPAQTSSVLAAQGKGIFRSVTGLHVERNGQSFELLGSVTQAPTADQKAVTTYRAKFSDGLVIDALAEEVNTAFTKHQNHDLHTGANGISSCKTCRGHGTSLPRECPGYRMSEWQSTDIGLGKLQFVNGRWTEVVRSAYAYTLLQTELEIGNCSAERAQEIQSLLKKSNYTFDECLGVIPKVTKAQTA